MMIYRGIELVVSKQDGVTGYTVKVGDNTDFCRSMSDVLIIIDEYMNEVESVEEHDNNIYTELFGDEPIEDAYYNGEVLGLSVERWNKLAAQGWSFEDLEELDNRLLAQQIKRIQGVA